MKGLLYLIVAFIWYKLQFSLHMYLTVLSASNASKLIYESILCTLFHIYSYSNVWGPAVLRSSLQIVILTIAYIKS